MPGQEAWQSYQSLTSSAMGTTDVKEVEDVVCMQPSSTATFALAWAGCLQLGIALEGRTHKVADFGRTWLFDL